MIRKERGFTLIELLVVIAIFTILTATLLLVRPSSDDQTQLRNAAEEIAQFIREAQVYGSGVRNPGVIDFSANYGVHISSDDRTTLILFVIQEGAGYQYSEAPAVAKNEISRLELPAGFRISDFCVGHGSSSQRCASSGTGSGGGPVCDAVPSVGNISSGQLREIDIIFKRPSLDALILAHRPGPCRRGDRASIELTYRGASVEIEVAETGLMQVRQ